MFWGFFSLFSYLHFFETFCIICTVIWMKSLEKFRWVFLVDLPITHRYLKHDDEPPTRHCFLMRGYKPQKFRHCRFSLGSTMIIIGRVPFTSYPEVQDTLLVSLAGTQSLSRCTMGPLASNTDMLSLPLRLYLPVRLILMHKVTFRHKTLVAFDYV